MKKIIGKVAAIEKAPTTIDSFYFWTDKLTILSPFDVVKVDHVEESTTFGVIEEISHITDSGSYLTNYISSDFGDVNSQPNTSRIGMNYVKAKVVGNNKSIYIPVLDGKNVGLAEKEEVAEALGIDKIDNPMPCGYLQMYKGEDEIELPVYFNAKFLTGPEGAHLNISGISGLASKTSYAMFLIKAMQQMYLERAHSQDPDEYRNDSIAFVILNVKGKDLLAIDEVNNDLPEHDKNIYKALGLNHEPFVNVSYIYPHADKVDAESYTYAPPKHVKSQIDQGKAYKYKYVYEDDKDNLDLFFSNVDDPNDTMASIINHIISDSGEFGKSENWNDFLQEVDEHCKAGSNKNKEIHISSWRKFYRIMKKSLSHPIFSKRIISQKNELRLRDKLFKIQKNDVFVIDIAKLDQDTQSFVFGDVIRAVHDLKLGQVDREESEIPSKIVVFVDELNKYASNDVPRNSPILRQLLDITERGRSLGIILFSAEQFKSSIHDRIKGNCASHSYGRTNAIEISKNDYKYIPTVFRNMMTRLEPGEYIIEHPIHRSLLHIKFPKPVYNQKL